MAEKVYVNSPASWLLDALKQAGYAVHPDVVNSVRREEAQEEAGRVLREAREAGLEPRTLIIALYQGPRGAEVYATSAPPEVVEKADYLLSKLESKYDYLTEEERIIREAAQALRRA